MEDPRILCVDDHVELCETLRSNLSLLPARVDVAFDGDTAVEAMLAARQTNDDYKLVILDMFVPRRPGDGQRVDKELAIKLLLEQQRTYELLRPNTPVIVYTAHASYSDCVKCMRYGAANYLPKKGGGRRDTDSLDDLCQLCDEILSGSIEPQDDLRRWLDANLQELAENFGGHFISTVDPEVARRANVEFEVIDGLAVIKASSVRELRTMILRSPVLRWEAPTAFQIPNRVEPTVRH